MGNRLKILLVVIIVLLGAFAFANSSMAYDLYLDITEGVADFVVVGDTAQMSGVITTRTVKDVKKLLEEYPELKTIELIFVPGSADDDANLEASRLIREAGINTHVPEGGDIASGGVDFFCAGVIRTAHEDSFIGVHSWGDGKVEDANLLPKDHPIHKIYLDFYREMNIPDDFYWFTIQAAPADGIHNMTQDERVKYGLIEE